jgi:uncharacterized protein YjbJ (UPF0337 family)
MNRNQEKGAGKQIKGTIKEAAGHLTGDKVLKGEGKIQKGAGKVQTEIGNAQARSRRNDPTR